MRDDWYVVRYPSSVATEGEVLTSHHYATQEACDDMCKQLAGRDRRGVYESTQLNAENVDFTIVIPIVQPSTATLQ